MGRPGGDEDLHPRQIVGEGQLPADILVKLFGVGHLAQPVGAAGEVAGDRVDLVPAVAAELFHILLDDRIDIHPVVHRRGKINRALAGEDG